MHGMGHETLGLSVTQDDSTLAPATFAATARRPQLLRFRVVVRDGAALRSGYEIEAQRRLHLIVVRRDLTGYQHLHPTMSSDGTWSVPVKVAAPGAQEEYFKSPVKRVGFPSFRRFYKELRTTRLIKTFDPEDWGGKGPVVWVYDITKPAVPGQEKYERIPILYGRKRIQFP